MNLSDVGKLPTLEVWTEHTQSPSLLGYLSFSDTKRRCFFSWSRDCSHDLSPLRFPMSTELWDSRRHHLPREYKGLPGLIHDSLPDGWGRRMLDEAIRRWPLEQNLPPLMRQLLWLDHRSWGSLFFKKKGVKPSNPGLSPTPGAALLGDWIKSMRALIDGKTDVPSLGLLYASGSPQGARPKFFVDLDEDEKTAYVADGDMASDRTAWLFKFAAKDETEDAPIIEEAYARVARTCGIAMMPMKLREISGHLVFSTQRFDRTAEGRKFCHSLGGLMHVSHREMNLDRAHLAQVLDFLGTDNHEHRQVFRRACFDAATSVRDDHAKNFAFMLDSKGRWSFAPSFDVTYSEGPGGYHSMSFAGGSSRDPTRDDLVRLGGKHHLDKHEAAQIVDEVRDVVATLPRELAGLGARKESVSQIRKTLARLSSAQGLATSMDGAMDGAPANNKPSANNKPK